MKRIMFSLAAVFAFLLVACYEVNEEIEIREDGSGVYVTKMDMSALVGLIQTMASEEELAGNGLNRSIDTTFRLGGYLDTASDVTAEQKKAFGQGAMRLQMDFSQSLFKADLNFPFGSGDDLQILMNGAGAGGMSEVFRKLSANNDASSAVASPDQGLDQINHIFDVTVTKNSIARRLNREKYDSLLSMPEIAQARQMMGSGFEIVYSTTIRFPRAVTKSDNPLVTLSDDRKTATIRYDMMKLFESPDQFSYEIYY